MVKSKLKILVNNPLVESVENTIPLRNNSAPSNMMDMTDDDLWLLVRCDRKDAFEILIKRYERLIIGFAVRYLGDESIGKDAAQDVFLSMWAERERKILTGRFKAFIIQVVRNRCNYLSRQRKSHKNKLSRLKQIPNYNDETLLPAHELIKKEKAASVFRLMNKINKKSRSVMILRYSLDLDVKEIGSLLDMPEGTVKSHLSRGVKKLHALWKKETK